MAVATSRFYLVSSRNQLPKSQSRIRIHRSQGHIRDQIISVLALLETTESHLGAWNVLLWILKVFELGGELVYFNETAQLGHIQESLPSM